MTEQYRHPNPFQETLNSYVNNQRKFPHNYQRLTNSLHLQMAEHHQKHMQDQIRDVETICFPTLVEMRDVSNMLHLQERIFLKLNVHIKNLETCYKSARTNEDGDFCIKRFDESFENKFKPDLKKILQDY